MLFLMFHSSNLFRKNFYVAFRHLEVQIRKSSYIFGGDDSASNIIMTRYREMHNMCAALSFRQSREAKATKMFLMISSMKKLTLDMF